MTESEIDVEWAGLERKVLEARQRALDELAAKIVSTRRQLDGVSDTLNQLGREGLHNPVLYGVSVEYVKDVERALKGLARIVETSGGRA